MGVHPAASVTLRHRYMFVVDLGDAVIVSVAIGMNVIWLDILQDQQEFVIDVQYILL